MNKSIKSTGSQRFQPGKSGNPKGRPRGVSDRRNAWREALLEHLPDLVDHLVKKAKAGDEFAIKLILERVAPPMRPCGQVAEVPGLDAARGLSAKADAVLGALGRGQISVDSGRALLDAIGAVAKITEIDDLLRRIEQHEQTQEAKS